MVYTTSIYQMDLSSESANRLAAEVNLLANRMRSARLLEGRAYRQSWANELHPSKKGFEAVAAEFSKVILALD